MKTLLINGSPRGKGNTAAILDKIAEGLAQEGVETETVHLPACAIQPCIGCERCRRDKTCTQFYDGMHLLYKKIEDSRGLVVGSPAYNYNVTPWMKAFIDRLYPYYDFEDPRPGSYRSRLQDQGRKAVIVAVGEQNDAGELGYTIPAMRDPLKVLGYEIIAELPITGHFAMGSVNKDPGILAAALEAGRQLAHSLKG